MSQFYLKGIPTKRRPRFTKNGHAYADPVTVSEEAAIAAAYRGPFHNGKVAVRIDIYPKLPKSTPKGITRVPAMKRPDVDNVAKIVLDGLQGKAYADDKQVTYVKAVRHDMQRIDYDYIAVTVTEHEREL